MAGANKLQEIDSDPFKLGPPPSSNSNVNNSMNFFGDGGSSS